MEESENNLLQIVVRLNGGKHKNDEELRMDLTEALTLKHVLKMGCRKFTQKEDYNRAKLYNKDGVLILDNDFGLISSGEVLYISPKGKYL